MLFVILTIAVALCSCTSASYSNDPVQGRRQVSPSEHRTDQILVKFNPEASDAAIKAMAEERGLELVRIVAPLLYLFKITGERRPEDIIGQLKRYKEVEYAEPNYTRKPR